MVGTKSDLKHYIKHKLILIKQEDQQQLSLKSKNKSEYSNLDLVSKKFTNDLNISRLTQSNKNSDNSQCLAACPITHRHTYCDYCNHLKATSITNNKNSYLSSNNDSIRPISIRSKISQQNLTQEFLIFGTDDNNNDENEGTTLEEYKRLLSLIRSVSVSDEKSDAQINMNESKIDETDLTMLMIDDEISSLSYQKHDFEDDDSDIGENELFEKKYPLSSPITPNQIPYYSQFDEYKIDSSMLNTPSNNILYNDTTFSTAVMTELQQKQLDKLMVVRKKQCLKMKKVLNANVYVQCSALDDFSIRKLMEEALLIAVNYHNNKLKLNLTNNHNTSCSSKFNNTQSSNNPLISISERLKILKRSDSTSRSSRKDQVKINNNSNDKTNKVQRKPSRSKFRCFSCTAAVSRSETVSSMTSNKNIKK